MEWFPLAGKLFPLNVENLITWIQWIKGPYFCVCMASSWTGTSPGLLVGWEQFKKVCNGVVEWFSGSFPLSLVFLWVVTDLGCPAKPYSTPCRGRTWPICTSSQQYAVNGFESLIRLHWGIAAPPCCISSVARLRPGLRPGTNVLWVLVSILSFWGCRFLGSWFGNTLCPVSVLKGGLNS